MMKAGPPPANYAVFSSAGEHRRFCREKVMAGRLLFADSVVAGRTKDTTTTPLLKVEGEDVDFRAPYIPAALSLQFFPQDV